MHAYLVVQ